MKRILEILSVLLVVASLAWVGHEAATLHNSIDAFVQRAETANLMVQGFSGSSHIVFFR